MCVYARMRTCVHVCARLFVPVQAPVCGEADLNRGPADYQPNALPLGQTGSHDSELVTVALMN